MNKILLTLLSIIALLSCSNQEEVSVKNNLTDIQIYQNAINELKKENYLKSIDYLQKLEERFPFGDLASKSQLLRMYANYKAEDYDNVRIIAERFIKLNALHKNLDFAYYMKALSSFYQNDNFISKYSPIDHALKDVSHLKKAFEEFNTLLKIFPKSEFVDDSIVRLNYIKNSIARNELSIAKFYLEKQNFVASLNRANYIIENLQDTVSVSDAIAIAATCSLRMNLKDMEIKYLKLLKLNYPNHQSISKGNFEPLDNRDLNYLNDSIVKVPYDIDRIQASKVLNEKYEDVKKSLQKELDLKIKQRKK